MHNAILQKITKDNKYLEKNMLIPAFVFAPVRPNPLGRIA
jgi:hypothetical protein